MSAANLLVVEGDGPIVATAIHDGHVLRDECRACCALDDAARLREEDPYTGRVAQAVPTHLIPRISRFEVDLNRPRESAVYRVPADAWGLTVWRETLTDAQVARSLAAYDAFYAELGRVLDEKRARYGRFVVLDVHSYNHRRDGADKPPADPDANPEINLGTESIERGRWGALVDRFSRDLASAGLDVRENVKFKGGAMSRWINARYAGSGCAIAIELKKTFMDEWTGVLDEARIAALRDAIAGTLPGLVDSLRR